MRRRGLAQIAVVLIVAQLPGLADPARSAKPTTAELLRQSADGDDREAGLCATPRPRPSATGRTQTSSPIPREELERLPRVESPCVAPRQPVNGPFHFQDRLEEYAQAAGDGAAGDGSAGDGDSRLDVRRLPEGLNPWW